MNRKYIQVYCIKSPATTTTTTATLTTTATVAFSDIFETVTVLNGFVWLGQQQSPHNILKRSIQSLFIDETSKYPDGKCAAIQPDISDVSKFHLYAVDCDSRAISFCTADVTYPPPPGDNLPKMPCIPSAKRKKRSVEEVSCNLSDNEECETGIKKDFFIPEEHTSCNSSHGCSWEESIEMCDTVGDGLAVPMEEGSSINSVIASFLSQQDDRRRMFYVMVIIQNFIISYIIL